MPTYLLRPVHVGMVLVADLPALSDARSAGAIASRCWTGCSRRRASPSSATWSPGATSSAIAPSTADPLDFYIGVVLIVLVLEATRRTTGWIMPVVSLLFLAYALFGPYLPAPWTHRGYDVERLVGHLYMTLEGIFGIAVDVSSSADHPVHDLRRVPAVLGRRQVLHRLLVRRHGRQAATAPAARSCCRRSCSADRRAPAWRRR